MKLLVVPVIFLLVNAASVNAGLWNSIKEAANNAVDVVSNATSSVVSTIATVPSSFSNIPIVDMFGSLVNGVAQLPTQAGMLGEAYLTSSKFLLTGIDPFFNAERDVFFLLFTSSNKLDGQKINATAESINSSHFNKNNPVRVIIHGYLNNHDCEVATNTTAAFLACGEYNVIVVDWGYGANDASYIDARLRVDAVSKVTAKLLNFLISNGLTTHDKVIITGHSLGGQTAGLTAKKIEGGKVAAVIAYDPAGPLFNPKKTQYRVAQGDAKYVEILHTNGGVFGMMEPCGDADFYVNGGRTQSGCGGIAICPHLRAYTYYAESICVSSFRAVKCASYDEILNYNCTVLSSDHIMGGDLPTVGQSGVFFLGTNSRAPFAEG